MTRRPKTPKPLSPGEEALALHLKGDGIAFEREYKFHPARKWKFDFALPDKKLAIEVEGGTWIGGSHNRGERYEQDCEKYNAAAVMGWRVLRYTTSMVQRGEAIAQIGRLLA